MCGRYFLGARALEKALEEFGATLRGTFEYGEIGPGREAPALVSEGKIEARPMRWGFERPEGGLVINARVETAAEKPMFRGLAQSRRCLLPAEHYFEWRRSDRQKYSVDLEGSEGFYLAGLYRKGPECQEFVVLTQPPVPAIATIHNRMPLILDSREAALRWLNGETRLYEDGARVRVRAEGPEQLSMQF